MDAAPTGRRGSAAARPGPRSERRPEQRPGRPYVTTCIIARDEAANLPSCIASVAAFADEVVVYDTGSLDATAEVARSLGATVVEGAFGDGFATARNAALAHCSGEWVLSLDADEELRCAAPARVLELLHGASTDLLALQVSIDNLTGAGLGAGYAHVAERLFRRLRCAWRGRLHEQLVDVSTGELARSAYLPELRIAHRGYLDRAVRDHDKTERNLRLARAEVDDPSFGDRGLALVALGRALWSAERPEEALGPLLEGAAATPNPTARRQGLAAAARILTRLDRLEEAEGVVTRLRGASTRQVLPDVLAAGVHLASGRPGPALALLDGVPATVRDDDGYEHGPHTVAEWRAAALLGLGRPGEAADLLLTLLRERGVLDAELDLVVEALGRAGRPLDELAEAVPATALGGIVAAALRLEPRRADDVFEVLWRRAAGSDREVTVLAGAALLGLALPAREALAWSRRLRDRGLAELCPLLALAEDPTAPPARRAEAAVAAVTAFGDERALPALAGALPGLDAEQVAALGAGTAPGWLDDHVDAARERARPAVRRAHAAGPAPEVSLVVLASGGAEAVLGCLGALAATLPASRPFEVVVVDPGSSDATAHVLDGLGGDVVVVRSEAGIGAARARNLGADEARGGVLVFLDGTTRPHPGWLEPLLDALAARATLGAVGALLVEGAGQVRSAGATVHLAEVAPVPSGGLPRRTWVSGPPERRVALEWVGLGGSPDALAERGPADGVAGCDEGLLLVPAVTAAALAVRQGAFEEAGGFDEGYWSGGEDLHLCLALRHAGWEVACQRRSVVTVTSPFDVEVAPFAPADPRPLPFAAAAGLAWQLRDNEDRLRRSWGHALSER